MAIDGRINIDVLFHDTDGTTSLKVVSLEDSTAYTTGKVAIVTGTVGTAAVEIALNPLFSSYRDSSGADVEFASLQRLVFSASPAAQLSSTEGNVVVTTSASGRASVLCPYSNLQMATTSGTATYTLVLYGT